jgi:hypothetical protein
MITSRLMFCSHGAVRDAETNTISVFSIWEEMQAATFPLFIQRFFVVAFLAREQGDGAQSRLTLNISLGDQLLNTFPIAVDFGDKLKSRLITEVNGLPIPGPGTLRFEVLENERLINAWDIGVTAAAAPQLRLQPA